MIRFIVILLVIYIGGYAAVRTMNMEAGSEGKPGTVVYTKDLEILSTVFSPLAMLDKELTGTLSRVGEAAADGDKPADADAEPAASDG